MDDLYYNRQGEPITLEEGMRLFGTDNTVARTIIGSWMVSTVFLVIDHGFGQLGPPVLFETLIVEGVGEPYADNRTYGRWVDLYSDRYCTEEAALAGHDQALAWLKTRLRAIGDLVGEPVETPETP